MMKNTINRARRRIIGKVIASRILILLCMAWSNILLPDFDPGEGVKQFPLRISWPSVVTNEEIQAQLQPQPLQKKVLYYIQTFYKAKTKSWAHAFQKVETEIFPDYFGIYDFQIHLLDSSPFSENHDNIKNNCFCIQGHACDPITMNYVFGNLETTLHCPSSIAAVPFETTTIPWQCADNTPMKDQERIPLLDMFYYWILTPVTRWDAARFLTIAVDPCARYPYRTLSDDDSNQQQPTAATDELHCKDDASSSSDSSCSIMTNTTLLWDETAFVAAEEAHAFYPLMPLILRHSSLFLSQHVPEIYLPPTFEGVVTLTGILWSWFMLIISALALHLLTFRILSLGYAHYYHARQGVSLSSYIPHDSSPSSSWTMTAKQHIQYMEIHETKLDIANLVTTLFLCSPSTLFFTIPYSESTFSAFTFLGYCIALSPSHHSMSIYGTNLVIAVAMWMLASGTRSNGSIQMCYIIMITMGTVVYHFQKVIHGLTRIDLKNLGRSMVSLVTAWMYPLWAIIWMTLLLFPPLFHDYLGYLQFCSASTTSSTSLQYSIPSWCQSNNIIVYNPFQFSLYRYVQEKHWNVGLFHYYEMKNIPNFLLAAPIVLISIYAIVQWLQFSVHDFCRYVPHLQRREREHGREWEHESNESNEHIIDEQEETETSPTKSRFVMAIQNAMSLRYCPYQDGQGILETFYVTCINLGRWGMSALTQLGWIQEYSYFSDSRVPQNNSPLVSNIEHVLLSSPPPPPNMRNLLLGPLTLPYYPILGAMTIVGVSIAHVEVSIRLICSTCPAFYWFCAYLFSGREEGGSFTSPKQMAKRFFFPYIFVGILLFSNWLRWT